MHLKAKNAAAAHLGAALLPLLAFCSAGLGAEPAILIHAGTLLAVPGTPPRSSQSIVIENGRVREILDGFIDPSQVPGEVPAQLIDLSAQFVLPGLIDAHTHVMVELGPDYKLDQVRMSDADKALSGAQFARRTLLAGFTTIRDLGSDGEPTLALRDAIAAGKVPGPLIVAAGNAIWATGHYGGYRPEVLALFDTTTDCNGADDCRRAVRAQVGRGADVIKLHATGAVLSAVAGGVDQQLTDAELRAIVSTAHRLGRRAAAHAHGTAGINAALRAGVDSIEHGTYADDTSIALFRKTGAYLVPTLMAGEGLLALSRQPGSLSGPERDKAAMIGDRMRKTLTRAYRAGVKIAFGTDSGVTPHGRNAREFELMVAAGMSPEDAIRAATLAAADLLDLTAEVGSLEPGKAADLIATRGNPLEDISALRAVDFVMRAGVVYKP